MTIDDQGVSISDIVNLPVGTILVKVKDNEYDYLTIGKWVEIEGMQLIREGMVTEFYEMKDQIRQLQSSSTHRYKSYE